MVHLQSAAALGGGGPVRLLVRAEAAGSPHTRHGVSGLLGHHCDARRGAHPRDRPDGQRHPRVVRDRRVVDAALRTDQDRVRRLGIAPVGRPADGAGLPARNADSVDPGGGDRVGAHRRPTGPRPDGVAGHHSARAAVVRRSAAEGLRHLVARRHRRRRGAGGFRWLPFGPCAILAGPRSRHPGRRLSGPAGQVRASQRGRLRRRTGSGNRQVELPAQCPQRLHLRHRRRGTRLHRGFRPARAVRPVRLHRHADLPAIGGPVPATVDRHRDRVGNRSGIHQRRVRGRIVAGHRDSAAADLSRRNLNGDNAIHGGPHG